MALDPIHVFEARVAALPKVIDIVEDIFPPGNNFSILAGRPGIGKSVLGLQLAFCVATGTGFLGFKVNKGIAGYMTFESSREKLLDRIRKMGRNFPDPGDDLRVDVVPMFKLAKDPKRFQAILEDCRLVVIDTLRYLVQGDYTRPSDASVFLDQLLSVLQPKGTSVVFCHHIRKPDQRSLLDPGNLFDVKGAGDYCEAATSVLLLERVRQGHKPTGGYAAVNPNMRTLYFPKTRDAVAEMNPIDITLNRAKLIFENI